MQQNNINPQNYQDNINEQKIFNSLYEIFAHRYLNHGNMNPSQIQQKVNLFCKQNNCSQQTYNDLFNKVTQEYYNHNNDVNFLTPTSPQTRQRKPGRKLQQQYKQNNDVNMFFNGDNGDNGYSQIPTQTQNGDIPTPTGMHYVGDSQQQSVNKINKDIRETMRNYIPNNNIQQNDIQQNDF